MRLRPCGDRMVVKQALKDEQLPSGIYLPEFELDNCNEGTVLRLGFPGTAPAEVGERVVFVSYGGTEVTLDGEKYLILDYKHILCVVEPKGA